MRVLSRRDVLEIVRRFTKLNPYDRKTIREILKIEDVNFDGRRHRALFGIAISAKRYVLYERSGKRIIPIDPKAHGLGYLYPPTGEDAEPAWNFAAWDWLVGDILRLPTPEPEWFNLPAMMRLVLSTPNVLRQVRNRPRPFTFVFYVVVDGTMGYPLGVDDENFTLLAPFTKNRRAWIDLPCINVHDGQTYRLSLVQSARIDRVIPQTFSALLRRYRDHPESKSLAPNGSRCVDSTRGLLLRDRVVAGTLRGIGKEADRRWQHGEDASLVDSKVLEYRITAQMVRADGRLRRRIESVGIRETMRRTGFSQHTVERIRSGRLVRFRTLERLRLLLTRD